MRFLYFITDTFIDTFGITRPDEKGRRQASFFILALLILAVAGATGVFYLIESHIR